MAEYISYFVIGFVILSLVEATVWLKICLGLSMKHREISFTTMMLEAPYRVFWTPKLVTSIMVLGVFCVSANYYRSGGQDIGLAIAYFATLTLFVALVLWEGVQAVKRYEEQDSPEDELHL